jgi:methyltransferase-like protein
MKSITEIKRAKMDDLEFGLSEEIRIKPILEEYFNKKLTKPENQYSKYDLKGYKLRVEIKTRRFNHNQYRTTYITKYKTDYAKTALKRDKECYFVFNFEDGIYTIKYDTKLFKSFDFEKIYVEKRNEYVICCLIPIKYLINISTGKTDEEEMADCLFSCIDE